MTKRSTQAGELIRVVYARAETSVRAKYGVKENVVHVTTSSITWRSKENMLFHSLLNIQVASLGGFELHIAIPMENGGHSVRI